jgi:hypothetical protein
MPITGNNRKGYATKLAVEVINSVAAQGSGSGGYQGLTLDMLMKRFDHKCDSADIHQRMNDLVIQMKSSNESVID